MRKIAAALLAAVFILLLPFTVSAVSVEDMEPILKRIEWQGEDPQACTIGSEIPSLDIYQLNDPYLSYEALFEMEGNRILPIYKDGVAIGYAEYYPNAQSNLRRAYVVLEEDTYTKLLRRYGDGLIMIYGGKTPFIILPEENGPTVYPLRSINPADETHSYGVPFADFMLCLTCEGLLKNTSYSISESVGIYSDADITTARDYWENKELWDKRLHQEKTKDYIPFWASLLLCCAVTAALLAVIVIKR